MAETNDAKVDRLYRGVEAPAGWRRLNMGEIIAWGSPKYPACMAEAGWATAGRPVGFWWKSRRSEWWFRVCAAPGGGVMALPFMIDDAALPAARPPWKKPPGRK